ncbi:hypothetical protein N9L19_00955 [bacterium]|nr:hypothetical protein [bacterium]
MEMSRVAETNRKIPPLPRSCAGGTEKLARWWGEKQLRRTNTAKPADLLV